jgi:uncharacterized membrane protein YcaP (DUF421 family)
MYLFILFQSLVDKNFLIGSEDWEFLGEVILRTFVMFLIIIIGIKILGKRGVKQLSIFELVVIIGLGSAAGDPMFYKETGVLTAVVVFIVVIALYRLMTYLIETFHPIEKIIEGKPKVIIKNGHFCVENSNRDRGTEELFSALRMNNVSQLGQVKLAIEEISGDISIFYYEDRKVKFGLPILPDAPHPSEKKILAEGFYACSNCAFTEKKTIGEGGTCKKCSNELWVKATNQKRIT